MRYKIIIEKYFEDTPGKMFDDPGYYKNCLTGEGQASQRLHQLLVKYLNCTDKKDRTVYRQQIVTAYWEFLRSLAPKMINPRIPDCKTILRPRTSRLSQHGHHKDKSCR